MGERREYLVELALTNEEPTAAALSMKIPATVSSASRCLCNQIWDRIISYTLPDIHLSVCTDWFKQPEKQERRDALDAVESLSRKWPGHMTKYCPLPRSP